MKILFPIGSIYPSQEGGPSNSVYWLAKSLVANGEDVTIVSTDSKLDKKVERSKWLQTEYGKVIFYPEKWHYLPYSCIKKSMDEMNGVDVVHLNSIFYTYSWIMGLIALWKGKKIVWSVRGELDEKAMIYSAWKKRIFLWFYKRIFSCRVTFHVTSPLEEAYTKKILGSDIRIFVIPNYMELPPRINTLKKFYFSYIGRIHPIKAIENLIDALALSQDFLESKFILKIAGDADNSYGQQLQRQVRDLGLKDKVEFMGHIEGNAKEEFLAKAYFNFMPSHTENFGLVVIEALAQGTPVVASKGTPWQILEVDGAGFWVDNSSESLAKVINKILCLNQNEYEAMAKKAYNLVIDDFDIYKNIDKWLKIYKV